MPPEITIQSQESTQQPSIEIQPATVATSAEPPLSTVNEESPEILNSDARSSTEASLGRNGFQGSSVEETGESGLNWTQSQIKQNQRLLVDKPEGRSNELNEDLEVQATVWETSLPDQGRIQAGTEQIDDQLAEESEDEVITSPDIPGPSNHPRWNTRSPVTKPQTTARASSPLTELDELANDSSREMLDLEGGLEETEVDVPQIQTPEQSPPPSTPPARRVNSFRSPTSPQVDVSGRKLRGVTSYSPSKFLTSSNGHQSNRKSTDMTPFKPFASEKTLMINKRSEPSQDSEESLFGKEAEIVKKLKPIENLQRILSGNADATVRTEPSRLLRRQPLNGMADKEEQEGQPDSGSSQNNGTNVGAPKGHIDGTQEEQEDEQEGVNWEKSLPVNGDTFTDRFSQTSPTPPQPHIPPNMPSSPHQSQSQSQSLPAGNNTRLHHFAYSGSIASQGAIHLSDGLFSDVGDEVPDFSQSQHDVLLPATQMFARQSSPYQAPLESLPEETRSSRASVASQPDDTQLNEQELPSAKTHADNHFGPPSAISRAASTTSITSRISVPSHRQLARRIRTRENSEEALPTTTILFTEQPSGVHKSPGGDTTRRAVSRAPSDLSTTSRISVPTHRLLTRRKRAQDESDVFPPNLHRTASAVPTETPALALKLNQSETAIPRAGSSPFKKSSPHRVSSEPPMLQETLRNSIPSGSSLPQGAQHAAQNSVDAEISPAEAVLKYTSPVAPSFPFRRSLSPTSPSLKAVNNLVPPNLPSILEKTQMDEKPDEPAAAGSKQDDPTLQPAPAPRTSPKHYAGRNKRKRIVSSPNSDDGMKTDSSSTTPEDEEDHTYRPVPETKLPKKMSIKAHGASSKPRDVSKSPDPLLLSSKRKRKPIVRSSSACNPPSDSQSSSSAPEDLEDNTYQPSLLPKLKNPLIENTRKRGSAPSSTSSGIHVTKKVKKIHNNAQVARLSPSISISSLSEAVTAKPERFAVLAAFFHRYYAGEAVWTGRAYNIEFCDGEKKQNVKPDMMRRLILKKGDALEGVESTLPKHLEVAQDWDGHVRGVKCVSLKGEKLGRVPLKDFGINNKVIHASFSDRLFEDPHASKITRSDGHKKPSIPRSPTKRSGAVYGTPSKSARSNSPTRLISNRLKGMLFFITKGTRDDQASITLAIRQNAGKITTDWEDLFDKSSPGGYGFDKNLDGTPFLILLGGSKGGTIITPKAMVALAKGIPCLSERFVDDISEGNDVDWRSYLISPGFSIHVEHYMSQVVDIAWGGEGWDPEIAGPIRRPMKGKTILFVLPGPKFEGLKRLIPVCAYSMGADELHTVTNTKTSENTIKDSKWNYILFEDREYIDKHGNSKSLPKWLSDEKDRLVNVHWLKQCLITGRALPPSLDLEKTEEKKK
ncbi:uncharacterized protein I206_101436 [Kwoniella pini CBS 10737]|uniref:BRCT domain-containing protein n=1 Tax=Kwoniella pini CBS 10737 TaxID=1296096 RepID=A0A1B9HWN3_9TREE|nr:uncharacterized protein I206_06593 [Kwoniella pini CBS 10737]OCF47687.1 hypothetical protein I206_06593 [Kwoniella pini CBS 10737]